MSLRVLQAILTSYIFFHWRDALDYFVGRICLEFAGRLNVLVAIIHMCEITQKDLDIRGQ